MAGDSGLERLPGCLAGGSGVTGGAPAGPGFDFVVGGVPEVYLEDLGEQGDALVVGLHASSAAGCQWHAILGARFHQLKHRRRFGIPDIQLCRG